MQLFLETALSFATLPPSVLMGVLVLYWGLVIVGALGVDGAWREGALEGSEADPGLFDALGLGRLTTACVLAVPAAAVAVRPLRPVFLVHEAPSRRTLLGRVCTVSLQRLAEARPAGLAESSLPRSVAPATPVPGELGRQLTLLEGTLLPLARLARDHLREGEGFVRAIQVWTQVSEALELLRTLHPPRP